MQKRTQQRPSDHCVGVHHAGFVEPLPDWDSTGTIAESWHAVVYRRDESGTDIPYRVRIDRFYTDDWALTVYDDTSGTPIRGGQNIAVADYENAWRRAYRLIHGPSEQVRAGARCIVRQAILARLPDEPDICQFDEAQLRTVAQLIPEAIRIAAIRWYDRVHDTVSRETRIEQANLAIEWARAEPVRIDEE
jgi:hypothetical protein